MLENIPLVHYYGFVSLFIGILTFMGYIMPKPFLLKNSGDTV